MPKYEIDAIRGLVSAAQANSGGIGQIADGLPKDLQCIDPTFQAHKLPGHDDIYNPVDNIIAGIRYTFDRYGGFEGHPGLKSMAGGGGYQGF
ncbi:hypothetical protein SAMN05216266_101271 [Amycolatopsis marina]|uniref:Transglycosylase SLT domain-containing protein n=1 Tax=Amycolatopsis marina TaxID=490629 RepID=A0A1I0VIF3_9PSEU|nr:hypothetical protein SAMN05216266_101271 [Amycolatopsis marina]